ncbi:hypothetical protein ACSFB8_09385 [Enterococcus faecalis]
MTALAPSAVVTIALQQQKVNTATDSFTFEIAATRQYKLLNGLNEIESTMQKLAAIEAYEKIRPLY